MNSFLRESSIEIKYNEFLKYITKNWKETTITTTKGKAPDLIFIYNLFCKIKFIFYIIKFFFFFSYSFFFFLIIVKVTYLFVKTINNFSFLFVYRKCLKYCFKLIETLLLLLSCFFVLIFFFLLLFSSTFFFFLSNYNQEEVKRDFSKQKYKAQVIKFKNYFCFFVYFILLLLFSDAILIIILLYN